MTRHFGIQSDRQRLGGISTLPAASRDTLRELPPLPRGSILFDGGFVSERDRNRLPIIVLYLGFLVPMILAGIMLHFR